MFPTRTLLAGCLVVTSSSLVPLSGARSIGALGLDGFWLSEGYGILLKIEGERVQAFELTSISCLPVWSGRRQVVRVITVIDKVSIRLIDGQLHGWTKYRWPLLCWAGVVTTWRAGCRRDDTEDHHQRCIQGMSQPRRWHRSIAA